MPLAEQGSQEARTAFIAVFVIALGLRLVLLGQHAFHMDEALYATFSRRILHGDLLLTGGLNNDKPPFQFYLGALGLGLFGEGESSIRLMDAVLSAMECGLLAWALAPVSGLLAALGAGFLLAASPLHRSYGATAVMDGPFSLFMLFSFVMAARQRALASGLAWGMAFSAKQTALFFLPLPWLALALSAGWDREAFRLWIKSASLPFMAVLLWSAVFAHPRLGAFLGMSAHQPEVGLRLSGLGQRLLAWASLSAGDWALGRGYYPVLLVSPLIALALWRRGGQRAAWTAAALFAPFGMLVYAAMNMRAYDRYPVPYAWALCALPALLAALPSPKGALRPAFAVLALGFGLSALFAARSRALPLDQQGAAGDRFDGYRALLVDLKRREPQGAALVSSQGGLRWMGGWYLGPGWALSESPELPDAAAPKVYAAEREGSALPPGNWSKVASYEGFGPPPVWQLYRAEGKRP